jgi:hypothetical protein
MGINSWLTQCRNENDKHWLGCGAAPCKDGMISCFCPTFRPSQGTSCILVHTKSVLQLFYFLLLWSFHFTMEFLIGRCLHRSTFVTLLGWVCGRWQWQHTLIRSPSSPWYETQKFSQSCCPNDSRRHRHWYVSSFDSQHGGTLPNPTKVTTIKADSTANYRKIQSRCGSTPRKLIECVSFCGSIERRIPIGSSQEWIWQPETIICQKTGRLVRDKFYTTCSIDQTIPLSHPQTNECSTLNKYLHPFPWAHLTYFR